ncbi:SDR family NAD(P)-dependent oxidoreductase [Celerinatantimonas diazotrophica]|uniref:Short-subunit dehydrogenase n=1 Tax=Celerinatantimonas diazotrophica TaxID=412034 RepID=A0A4R1K3V6_9GAMM|nr:SDR family oxidoreductase [Celerinatantimonas diazotrophica]TCK58587.1 short-subunit dehydrogenase [Celerinatantimonas diazotrophica]CAG9297216.1 1-deoxy-11-beta-hydroxypentalenate dehydrogenase [Celerinatantimonas diazotrophica]
MTHQAIKAGNVAVITGAASGIGLASARKFAQQGMQVLLTDINSAALEQARQQFKIENLDVQTFVVDVANRNQVEAAKRFAEQMGTISIIMSNAGREGGGELFAEPEIWLKTIQTNLLGAINITQIFLPELIAHKQPAAIIFTGSKQGITLPPGDYAYNVSKAGLKAFAESVAHELIEQRAEQISAHLLIPGFTYTGFTKAKGMSEKPDGAWSPEQVVDYLFQGLAQNDFYILCPDNEVDHMTDLKRIQWGQDDIIKNRPALSRWHPDFKTAFDKYMHEES